MEIDERIDWIAQKYNYNTELREALKRCIPIMIENKSNPEIELLMKTLERVEIIDFNSKPTKQQLDEVENRKLNEKNKHVLFDTKDKGEYGKKVALGAYHSIPIFDENMNIVERVGYIHLTRLAENSQAAKAYQSTINLSHLIHELGHAWSSQKAEYIQKENGDFTINIGMSTTNCKVNKENHTVTEDDVKGLFIEEALNTLEEENTLKKLLAIDSVNQIPGYVPSEYQGLMKGVIESFVQNIGQLPFSKAKILKDYTDLEKYQEILESTDATKNLNSKGWNEQKKESFSKVQELEGVPDEMKAEIQDFFGKYKHVFLKTEQDGHFFEKLDNVLEQLFDFNFIKYNFNILESEKNREIYLEILKKITIEAYAPLNEAKEEIENYNKKKNEISINHLAKQALETRSERKRTKRFYFSNRRKNK